MNSAGKCDCAKGMKYIPDWDKCVDDTVKPGPQCHGGKMNAAGKCECPPAEGTRPAMKYVPDWDKCVPADTTTGP